MSQLLKNLLASLFPGVNGEDDVPDPSDIPASDPGDDDPDDLGELDLPDDPPVRSAPRRADADERLARVEAELESRKRAFEASQRAAPTVDPEFQREEERLRSADISEIERWQIQANRTLRATQAEARQAMFQAQDMSDRTRFEAKFNSDPRRAKYADRVEEAVQQERAAGRNASRESVYFYMLGKDIAEGKLKTKAKATSAAPAVNRGKPAGVRSDIQGRGRPSSEKDKLRSRLENMNI